MKQILKFILFLVIITTLSNFITLIVMKSIYHKKEYHCVKFKYNEKYISQSDIYKEKEDKKEQNTICSKEINIEFLEQIQKKREELFLEIIKNNYKEILKIDSTKS
jgi:hypothetical protein